MSNLIVDNETQYEFFDTADGSPSIRLSSDKYRPEAMHHCDGALSESLFIYHEVLREALARDCPPRVLSIGLGCGYNEMITVAHFLSHEVTFGPQDSFVKNLHLESFEGDPNLREAFLEWLSLPETNTNHANFAQNSQIRPALMQTFDRVLHLVSAHFKIAPENLKSHLCQLKASNQFVLREWLTEQTLFSHQFGVIFFDAFSNQSTPELWTEEFLVEFLAKSSANKCGLATYAATGALNRALRRSNFIREPQAGFSGKRESTRAFK